MKVIIACKECAYKDDEANVPVIKPPKHQKMPMQERQSKEPIIPVSMNCLSSIPPRKNPQLMRSPVKKAKERLFIYILLQ